jgi:hypothetical protein
VHVWTVHATLADEVRPTQAIHRNEKVACAYAAELSGDDSVLAAQYLGDVGVVDVGVVGSSAPTGVCGDSRPGAVSPPRPAAWREAT